MKADRVREYRREKERNGGKKVWARCKSAAKNFAGRKLQNGKGQASTKWNRMETHERYKIKINKKTKRQNKNKIEIKKGQF